MNVTCAECGSVFRVDPTKIPQAGIRARCSVCGGVIAIGEHGAIDEDFIAPTLPRAASPAAQRAGNHPAPAAPPLAPTPPVTTAPPAAPTPRPPATLPTPPMLSRTPGVAERGAASAPSAAPAPRQAPGAPAAPARPAPAAPPVAPAPPRAPLAPPMSPAAPAAPAVRPPVSPAATPAHASAPRPHSPSTPSAPATRPPINPFLANDPNQKAKRLARALISDIIAYFPDKHREGLQHGTLRELFREEIKKSYEEYVEQMGKDFATSTTHFQDALNEVLAKGQKVF